MQNAEWFLGACGNSLKINFPCSFTFHNKHVSKKQRTHNEIHKPGNNLNLKELKESEDGINRKTKPGLLQQNQLFTSRLLKLPWVTSGKKEKKVKRRKKKRR